MHRKVWVTGKIIKNISYVDNWYSWSEQDLQTLQNKVARVGELYGLKINGKKTRAMIVSNRNAQLIIKPINNKPIEQVERILFILSMKNSIKKLLLLLRVLLSPQSWKPSKRWHRSCLLVNPRFDCSMPTTPSSFNPRVDFHFLHKLSLNL